MGLKVKYVHMYCSLQIGSRENDTVKVLEALGPAHTHTAILGVLSNIHGPWSFVLWQVTLYIFIIALYGSLL